MDMLKGSEPDGIAYHVYLEAPQPNWIAEVKHPDGRLLTEKWQWAWEPRYSPDAADVTKAEETLDRLIAILRKVNHEERNIG